MYFVDGTCEQIDTIIYRTGYRITFPFLDSAQITCADNEMSLHDRVVAPNQPGLYFIGLVQPIGEIVPLAEAQAEWVADLLEGRGRAALPRRHATRDRPLPRTRYAANMLTWQQAGCLGRDRADAEPQRHRRRRPVITSR